MHKNDLIKVVANSTGFSQKETGVFVETFLDSVKEALKKGDKVTLIGFGTFSVVKTAARTGRNPQTGKEIKIPAAKKVKFSVGKALKESVK